MTNSTRDRLYFAAIELAAERGVDGMSVDDIAAQAGVAKGTVYYNFASKEDLVREALTTGLGRFSERLHGALRADSSQDRLSVLARAVVDDVVEHPHFARLLLAEGWRPGRPWYSELRIARDALVSMVADEVAPGSKSRTFAAGSVLVSAVVHALDAIADGSTSTRKRHVVAANVAAQFSSMR